MTISVVNHKGVTGKTTTTINLGSSLAAQGCSVLLVDFDAQGSLTYSLGIDDDDHTIADALSGEVSIQSVVYQREGMDVIPAGTTLAVVELSFDNYLILKEIDNILSTAVITEFSNALNIKIYGDVPHLYPVSDIEGLNLAMGNEKGEDDYFILANANFEFDEHVSICPVFVWRFEKKLITLIEALSVKSVL
ncbi:MAG: AAA family ATPase [Cyclobacteriaceae bacterium]